MHGAVALPAAGAGGLVTQVDRGISRAGGERDAADAAEVGQVNRVETVEAGGIHDQAHVEGVFDSCRGTKSIDELHPALAAGDDGGPGVADRDRAHAVHVGEAGQVHAGGVVAGVQGAPGLVGGVGQNRREQAGEGGGHAVERGLREASPRSVRRITIEAVFGGNEVDAAERVVAKVVKRFGRLAELQGVVGGGDGVAEPDQLAGDPGVGAGGVLVFQLDLVLGDVEAVEVAEQKAHGVADLAVLVAGGFEKAQIDLDVVVGVEARDPPAAHVGAVVFHERFDGQRVAAGLAHLLAVFVDHEPMREHGLERALPRDRQGRQQAVLEPAAVLVAAF